MAGWEGYIVSGIYCLYSDKQSFGQRPLDREDYWEGGGGMFVIGNVLILDWVRGSWVFIILLKQRKKGKFSDHHSKC